MTTDPASSGRRLVALDLGAESGRAVLGRFDGARLQVEEVHRFANRPVTVDGTLCWDFPALVDEVVTGVARAAARGGLDGVGVDAWGVDFGLLDGRGRLLGLPVHYRDRRTQGMMDEASRRVPREELFARTGIQFVPFNSVYQLLAMRTAGDDRLHTARTFLTMPDLLHRELCGAACCEYTNATTTQCLDAARRRWAGDVLERLGIPSAMFPGVVEPGTVLGPLTAAVSDRAGGARPEVIAPASHDTASAVAAIPFAGDVPAAYVSSGTWSLVGVETRAAQLGPDALAANVTNEGGVERTFRLLKNVTGLWLVQECRRAWAEAGRDFQYAELAAMAEGAAPGAAFIDPDDPRFLPPGDMPARIAAYLRATGQAPVEEPGQVVRIVLESLALKTRWVLEAIAGLTGVVPAVLHVVGGGVRNRVLCALTAEATGLPVLAGPAEATAVGNLLVQAIALGEVASVAEGRELVRRSFPPETYQPTGGAGAREEAWGRFVRLIS